MDTGILQSTLLVKQVLQNGDTKSPDENEVQQKVTPRFLGPPLKIDDFQNGNPPRFPDGFLPLGAGGPAPPAPQPEVEELPTPHDRFLNDPPPLGAIGVCYTGMDPKEIEKLQLQNSDPEPPITEPLEENDTFAGNETTSEDSIIRLPRCPPYENGVAKTPDPPVRNNSNDFDEGDAPTRLQRGKDLQKLSFPPLPFGPPPNLNDGKSLDSKGNSTPPSTPQIEELDFSRIPLGAGGPAPSTCHPLSKNGIPAQSPPRFPIGEDGWPQGIEKVYRAVTVQLPAGTEGPELRATSSTNKEKPRPQSLQSGVSPKLATPVSKGAIWRLAATDKKAMPGPSLSVAAPRRSISFVGFAPGGGVAASIAGSVHAHRQQFLQKRLLFEQGESSTRKTPARQFEIELRALKLGNKTLDGDDIVREEPEEGQTPHSPRGRPLRASFRRFVSRESSVNEVTSPPPVPIKPLRSPKMMAQSVTFEAQGAILETPLTPTKKNDATVFIEATYAEETANDVTGITLTPEAALKK